MAAEYVDSNEFRGARLHSCDLSGLRVTDGWLVDVNLSGFIRNLVVNDVDVTDYVIAELERRHPEKVQLRAMRTADDHRAMWDTVERMWAATTSRAERLTEVQRTTRVDGEWSFAETLRHLVFATDKWAGSAILDLDPAYHRLGLVNTGHPDDDAAALGIDMSARPTWAETIEARESRQAVIRGIVADLTDDALSRPAPRPPEEGFSVGGCLRVVMDEECEHHRYATRDLSVLEAAPKSGAGTPPASPA